MKIPSLRGLMFILIVFWSFSSQAQTVEKSIIYDFSPTNSNTPDSTHNEIQFLKVNEDKIIVAGQIIEDNGNKKIFTAAFDFEGQVIWEKILNTPTGFASMELADNKNLVSTSNGNYAIAGLLQSDNAIDTGKMPFVYLFNEQSGDSILYKSYNEKLWKLNALVIDPQGHLVLAGLTDKQSFPDGREYADSMSIIKINSQAQIINSSKIGLLYILLTNNDRVFNIQDIFFNNNDVNIAVTGWGTLHYSFLTLDLANWNNNDFITNYNYNSFHISSGGNSQKWDSKLWGYAFSANFAPIWGIKQCADNSGYYFLSYGQKVPGPNFGWTFNKFNNNNFTQSGHYGFAHKETPEYTTDSFDLEFINNHNWGKYKIEEAKNGDLLFLFTTAPYMTTQPSLSHIPFLMRVENSFQEKWHQTLSHAPSVTMGWDQSLNDIGFLPNHKIVLGGAVRARNIEPELSVPKKGKNSWLLILEDAANDSTLAISPNLKKDLVQLYPNPATQQVILSTQQPKIESVHFVDIMGRKVKTYIAPGQTLDISDLAKGIYQVEIHLGKEKIMKRLVIE